MPPIIPLFYFSYYNHMTTFASIDVIESMLKAWPNVRKMLQYRHYECDQVPLKIRARDINIQCIKTGGKIIISKHMTIEKKQIVVIFTPLYNVGINPVRQYVEWMRRNGVTNAVILSMNGPTPFTMKGLSQDESYRDVKIEFFEYQKLSYCVADHQIQPKQFILSPKNRDAVLKKYGQSDKFPLIKETDSLAKFYGMEKGDMMKILFTNGAQEYVTRYRVCA